MDKEAKEKEEGIETSVEQGMDALSKAMGKKDHRGHVKALGRCGVGVKLRRAFGKENGKRHRTSESSYSKEDLEDMKRSMNQEFEARLQEQQEKFQQQLQAYLSSITQAMGTRKSPLMLQPQNSEVRELDEMLENNNSIEKEVPFVVEVSFLTSLLY